MDYSIQLRVYEGPMDLLCDLVSKHKIEIKDISISEITKQYLEYISMMDKMDMEVTSDFITMSSKLLEIKSRFLLYLQREDEDEEDPRLELVEKIEEYKKYKEASLKLKEMYSSVYDKFYRKKEEIVSDDTIDTDDISIDMMLKLLPKLLKEAENSEKEIASERLGHIIREKPVSVEKRMTEIRDILKEKREVSFLKISKGSGKNEIIATFLSILELIKENEVMVTQDKFFDDIIISVNMES